MWETTDLGLKNTFVFNDFRSAIGFMIQAAFECEAMNHHPDWQNIYNKVHVCLCTHDKNNSITDLDYQLASALDAIYSKYYIS